MVSEEIIRPSPRRRASPSIAEGFSPTARGAYRIYFSISISPTAKGAYRIYFSISINPTVRGAYRIKFFNLYEPDGKRCIPD